MPITLNNGVIVHYQIKGYGEPMVLIHGIHGCGSDWESFGFVNALSKFQLILIDLRGHGKSSKPHEPSEYNPKLQANDIRAVLDDLNIKKAIIWGYSYGARMGFAFAIYYAKYVSRLIVGGMHPYPITNLYPKIVIRQELLKSGLKMYLNAMNLEYTEDQRQLFLKNDQLALIQMDESILTWEGFGKDLENLRKRDYPIIAYLGSEDLAYMELLQKFIREYPEIIYLELQGLRHFDALSDANSVLEQLAVFIQ